MSSFTTWIEPGALAISGRPWGIEGLMRIREQGISAVVSLTDDPLPPSELDESGLIAIHLPVADFTPPTLGQIQEFTEFMEEQRRRERAVLVHCTAGYGRSGTMAACHLVNQGMTAKQALAQVRLQRPGAVETGDQERMVGVWAEHVQAKAEGRE